MVLFYKLNTKGKGTVIYGKVYLISVNFISQKEFYLSCNNTVLFTYILINIIIT